MTIAFFTNTLNTHQIGLADELYELSNGNYTLIETCPLSDERRNMGFKEYDRIYKLQTYKSADNEKKAVEIAQNVDVAIMGAGSSYYEKLRIKRGGKLTFYYNERWLKRGIVNIFSPRLLKQMLLYHVQGGCHQPWYVLCASAYLPSDFKLLHAFDNRCYKWGYFTKVEKLDIDALLRSKRSDQPIKILWVARFLKLKHPEIMIQLAKYLKEKNVNFVISMIGSGVESKKIHQMIEKNSLENNVILMGNQPNEMVHKIMRESHIFCFTSDRHEGWGAVLGEAMSNGCCPVSSIETGATPFLVKDGYNGYTFKLSEKKSFFDKVLFLVQNDKLREEMSFNAYNTMYKLWNPKSAAINFIKLATSLLNRESCDVVEGPGSKAVII